MIMPHETAPRLFRSESMAQSLSVYLPATAASRMIGLIRGLLLAWLMAQEQWGLLQIALLVANLLNPLCSAGLNESVQRYVPMHEARGTLRWFLRLAVPLAVATAAVSVAVVLALASPLGELLFTALRTGEVGAEAGLAGPLTRVAAIAAFSLITFYLIISILRGLRMYRALGLIELAGNAAFTLLAVAVAWSGWNSAWPVMVCYAAALMGTVLIVAAPLRRAIVRIEPAGAVSAIPPEKELVPLAVAGQMARFSFWAALAAITWQILLGYPLWYLHKAAGATAASLFAGMQLIAQGMLIVANAIVIVVETAVTKTWESRGRLEADHDLLLAHKTSTLVLLAGGIVVTALAPAVLRILPAQYAAGAAAVPLLILFFLLAGHLLFLGVHFHLIERTRHLFVPWLLGVLAHVMFSALWVRPAFDPAGAALAASWAGVTGMSLALGAMLALMLAEHRPIDRGGLLLIAAGFSLALRSPLLTACVVAAVTAVAFLTDWVFDAHEKRRLLESARRVRSGLHRIFAGSRTP